MKVELLAKRIDVTFEDETGEVVFERDMEIDQLEKVSIIRYEGRSFMLKGFLPHENTLVFTEVPGVLVLQPQQKHSVK